MEIAAGERVTKLVDRFVSRYLLPVAEKLWPELKDVTAQKRLIGAGEVITFLYAIPLALAGFIWLILVTDFGVLRQAWSILVLFGALMFLFRKLGFFMVQEIRAGRYASADGSMDSMILWAAVFLVGPIALWMAIGLSIIDFIWRWHTSMHTVDRWNRLRNFAFYMAVTGLAALSALWVYGRIGGEIPISGLSPEAIFPALVALLVHFVLVLLIWLPYMAYALWTQISLTGTGHSGNVVRFLLVALALPNLAHPFSILMAGLYVQHGLLTFFFFVIGLLLVAVLARQLSWAAEYSRQQSRQLEKLEALGRAILNAPPDASTLPNLMQEYVPLMFPSGRIAIWIGEDRLLMQNPEEWVPEINLIWPWLQEQEHIRGFLSHEQLPWDKESDTHHAVALAPIIESETGNVIGGVYLEVFSLITPWDRRSLTSLHPAVLSLAAQVASALHQAEVYEQALAYQKVSQELSLAGKIQSSFLPAELPSLDGWQLAVTLLPARETSGDFFDLIPLEGGKLGLLIADVTDKGVGAALYMALSRTLIRTYAIEFDDDPQPEVVLFAANGRLLSDARADLFVTVFFAILDPEAGTLTYCNAGHNPPFLLTRRNGDIEANPLVPTGMPMGIEEDTVWGREIIQIMPGDVLVMYTDGIPDSQNLAGDFYGDDRLKTTIMASVGLPAYEIQNVLMDEVQDFTGDASQFDDITLLILERDAIGQRAEGDQDEEPANVVDQ